METDALIAAFRRLRNDGRREVMNALVNELTPYEWRMLKDITGARTFQFDIIGQLPVELVAQIFAYLDTSTPFRLQRVSRTWRHILQSPDVLKPSLSSWYGNTLNLRGTDYSLYESKAKHAHAFRHGEPNCSIKINLQKSHGIVWLIDDTLIWSGREDCKARVIYVFNISAWTLRSLNGDAREVVGTLFASDSLVGFGSKTSTVCYVWSLSNFEKRRFRLPHPVLVNTMACRGVTVACAARLDDHVLVYIWNYDTQQSRSFTISYDQPPFAYPSPSCQPAHSMILLPQPRDEHIIIFADDRCCDHFGHGADASDAGEGAQGTFRFGQFTYTGECIAHSELTVNTGPYCGWIPRFMNQPIPLHRDGLFRLLVEPDGCLQFDEKIFAFVPMGFAPDQDSLWGSNAVYRWKDVYFGEHVGWIDEGKYNMLVHLGTSDKPQFKPLTTRKQDAENESVTYEMVSSGTLERVLPNDKYVVRAQAMSLEILCFGEKPKHMDQSESFFGIGSSTVTDGAEYLK